MKTPFLVSLPSLHPPLVEESDRSYNSKNLLSPHQSQFISELVASLEKKNKQLLVLIFAAAAVFLTLWLLVTSIAPFTAFLFSVEALFISVFSETRKLILDLKCDQKNNIVEPIILKPFTGWMVSDSMHFSLLKPTVERDIRSGIRYVLPQSQLVIAVDQTRTLNSIETTTVTTANAKKILGDVLRWGLVQKLILLVAIHTSLFGALEYLKFTFPHNVLVVLGVSLALTYMIKLDTSQPNIIDLIKDLPNKELQTVTGKPQAIELSYRRRGRNGGLDTIVHFTINHHHFTVDQADFIMIESQHTYQVSFWKNSNLVCSINLA